MRARFGIALMLGLAAVPAHAGQAGLATPAGTFTVPVVSLREARFNSVVRQEHDFSCGSAAVATLLTYHYHHPIGEDAAFSAMYAAGDQDAIRRSGFSLADMQRYLATLGFSSDGFRVPLSKLAEIGVPAIALINTRGYNHFVVIKGLDGDDVLVGDPALGLRSIARAEFEAMWQGVAFVIRDDIDVARENFNRSEEWAVRRKAPFGTALNRQGLATFSTMLPSLFEF